VGTLSVLASCNAHAEDCIKVDKTVTITVRGNEIVSVRPQVALLRPGDVLTFVAEGLGENRLELDFNVVGPSKSPFREYTKDTPRGRFVLTAGSSKASATYDKDAGDGVWKYEVVLRDPSGKDLHAVDPVAVGKGGM
jgi:hypothetical protein